MTDEIRLDVQNGHQVGLNVRDGHHIKMQVRGGGHVRLDVQDGHHARLSVAGRDEIPMNIEHVREIYKDYPEYEGATVVTPRVEPQSLETRNTVLKRNIDVLAIPYYTTTNLSGGYTAIIGGQ